MKRDMELIRRILLQIEEKCDGMGAYSINSIDGYSYEQLYTHFCLIKEAGLLHNPKILMGGGLIVNRLSNAGYDFLEKIRNDQVWEQTKTEIKNKKLPETIEFISKIAGIFVGNLLGNIN